MPADKPLLATLLWVVALSPACAVDCPAESAVVDPLFLPLIEGVIPPGDDLVSPGSLREAVYVLRLHGMPDDQMVNSLYAAYCPRIAGNAALSETEKNDRATAFLSEAERVIFGGGGD